MDFKSLDLAGYRSEHGLLWPDWDRRCAEVTFREVASLDLVWRLIGDAPRHLAVQAGGNCGQLTRELAPLFDNVLTFEPDVRNFTALTVNTAEFRNVQRFQAALGDSSQCGSMRGLKQGDARYPNNCGALYVDGPGGVLTLTIDHFNLPICNLIMLDIEGGELAALRGAAVTIRKHSPAIVIEDKRLGSKFYAETMTPGEWLSDMGYQYAGRVLNDSVYLPCAR